MPGPLGTRPEQGLARPRRSDVEDAVLGVTRREVVPLGALGELGGDDDVVCLLPLIAVDGCQRHAWQREDAISARALSWLIATLKPAFVYR